MPWQEESRLKAFWAAAGVEVAAQRERLILWVPVWLGCGIGLYFCLPFEPPLFLGIGAVALLLALWALLWPLRDSESLRGYLGWLLIGALSLGAAGFCSGQMRTHFVSTPLLAKALDPVDVDGRLVGIDRLEEGQGTRIILDRLEIERLAPEKTPERIRLKVRQTEIDAHIGDRVHVLAGLNPPSAPVEPYAFDFQRYAYFKKLGAFGFTYRVPEVTVPGDPDGIGQTLEELRQHVRARIEAALPYPEAAIAVALMTGERTGISEEDWEAMRASGLAHMLAISGLHVGLVASVIFMCCRFVMAVFPGFALRHPIKKYAALLALLGAFSYMMMVGMTIPTLRALLMTGTVLVAIMLDRIPFSLRLVAIAASVILLVLPESLLGASFQMSFAAVASLIFFYELMRGHLSRWYRRAGTVRRLALYFFGVCMTTVIATIATGPFGLFHFQQFAVYSLLSNLFAVPLMAFLVMPPAVFSYVLMLCGLEEWSLHVSGWAIRAILDIAHGVTAMPLSTWTPPAAPLSSLLCLVGAALFIMLWKGRGRWLALLPLIASIVIVLTAQGPDILVSSSGKLIGLIDRDRQLWVSTKRSDRFDAEIWARRHGSDPEDIPKWDSNPDILCGEEGCRTNWNGRAVAVSYHIAAQAEDCAWADILITPEPMKARPCDAPVVIDLFDLRDHGAHAIWPDNAVKSVESVRGHRPWTVSNRR
ncbi:MAG: ComEC/Rec2 family competence protein [Rhodospirillales bacterium]|nr:ComEC/Rec2 family competence protein [Rhodospirillales bacterium]MCB9995630.1 ComEC/Rec2 family competence protein [Rhodospirillales bacterium]